jgi:hypothetical protein
MMLLGPFSRISEGLLEWTEVESESRRYRGRQRL